jgi:hypothetical protein
MRENKILAAIGETATMSEILPRAYDDTPALLWPLAARALEAHLAKLATEGRITRSGDRVTRGRS